MNRSSGGTALLDEGTKTAWIVLGIVELITGLVALAMPILAALASAVLLGAMLGIAGIARIVHAFQVRSGLRLAGDIILGILAIVASALILSQPMVGALSLVFITGLWCLAAGVVEIALSLSEPRLPGWGWLLASGVAGIVLGLMLLLGLPGPGLLAIGLLVGLNLVLTGIGSMVVGMNLPSTGMGLHETPTAPA